MARFDAAAMLRDELAERIQDCAVQQQGATIVCQQKQIETLTVGFDSVSAPLGVIERATDQRWTPAK